jgi:hypothetical protein
MGRGLVGNPIEAVLSRARDHHHHQHAAQAVRPAAPILELNDVTIAYDRHPVVHTSGAFAAGSPTALVRAERRRQAAAETIAACR